MKKLFLSIALSANMAHAAIPVATCGQMSGYSYVPNLTDNQQDSLLSRKFLNGKQLPDNWVSDGFSNGSINVVQLTKDKFDILIYNQPRNETFSTIKDGGRVIFIRGSDEEIVFMIMYPETVTVYTIVKTKQGSKVSVIESKNGMMIRTSMFSGSCTFVDWAKFK